MAISPNPAEQRVSHYRVLDRLGAGGMGDVYAAFDETLKRRVALKSIRPEHRLNAEAKTRFLREARLLSQLDHANVCRVHDYVEEGGGEWLVLELIEGKNLREAGASGLDLPRRLKIAEQIAAVLVATHAAGVVHRDLKPGNVMVTPTGDVKVLDFGLARSVFLADEPAAGLAVDVVATAPIDSPGLASVELTRLRPAPASLAGSTEFHTHAGEISGTIAYMSPEQAVGDPATTASDMYSFGLVLQELFTGRPPYYETRDSDELLERVRRGETPAATGIGTDLEQLIARLKSLAPSQRPTAVEVVERLRWIREKPARRLRRLAMAGVAAALVIGGVKYTIDLARERTIAVAARQDADRRRTQAETLIGFMLGDLRTKLQQVGRLELLEDVGKEATTYFKSVPASSLTGEELYRRSQAVYQIGQVHQAKGDLAAAMQSYRDSLALMEQVAARDPANATWQLGLGTSHFYVGDALRRQGDLDGALQHYQGYREIAERVAAKDPRNMEWKLEASFGHSNVAGVLEAKGDLTGSLAELDTTLALKQQVADSAPGNVEWQRTLASTHNRLGLVLYKLGALGRARDEYARDLAIEEMLLQKQPGNARLELAVSVAHSWLAMALDDLGAVDEASRHHDARLAITDRLVQRDPANAEWQRERASARMRVADVNRRRGRTALAESQYRESLATLTALLDKSPSAVALRRDVGSAHLRLTRLLFASKRSEQSAAEARLCAEVLSPLLTRDRRDRDTVRVAVDCQLWLAAGLSAAGRGAEGSAQAARALDAIDQVARNSRDPELLQLRARALRAAGREADARAVATPLLATGYRNPEFIALW
jgi:tetratricopeptide (TPR) repeat protein/tRNA A-37 threonylcarbamoyl transferase component Bud32